MIKTTKMVFDMRPMLRKRRLHMNEQVSRWGENFSCEGESKLMVSLLDDIMGNRNDLRFNSYGISKKEELASDFYGADGMRRTIGV